MSDYVNQLHELKAVIAIDEADLARVRLRLDKLADERAEADNRIEELAAVRERLVADAAFSDEAREHFATHDREVEKLERARSDLESMVSLLDTERSRLDAKVRESQETLQRFDELHMREVGKSKAAELAERFRTELTECALAHRHGSRWQSWSDARLALADMLFPADPLQLPREEREAIRHRITDGLLGAPAAQ